jgi:hypothetical protein
MEKLVFVISGKRETTHNRIWIDGKEVLPEKSFKLRYHSPTGFNWGYGGSGPAQTALAICLEIFPDQWMAEALYQSFKFSFVSKWREDEFTEEIDITDFLIDHRHLYQRGKENN